MQIKHKLLNMKNLIIIISIIFSFSSFHLHAQYYEMKEEKASSFMDKLFFGGGLGLQFGDVTQIEVSPIIGYKVTPRFHAGLGFSYSYYNDKRYTPTLDFSTYGASIFTRFFIYEGLFAQAEAEALNTKIFYYSGATERRWIESYFIGGGYYLPIGKRSGMYLLVLWNLNETEFTPYPNPVIRIGFSF